jgi:hypothetical protein
VITATRRQRCKQPRTGPGREAVDGHHDQRTPMSFPQLAATVRELSFDVEDLDPPGRNVLVFHCVEDIRRCVDSQS